MWYALRALSLLKEAGVSIPASSYFLITLRTVLRSFCVILAISFLLLPCFQSVNIVVCIANPIIWGLHNRLIMELLKSCFPIPQGGGFLTPFMWGFHITNDTRRNFTGFS